MKRIFVLTLSLFLIVFGLCACTPKDDNTIELNEVTHSIFYSPLYLAMSLGYFEDEGLTVNLTNGGGADKTMTAVLSGEADIGFCGPEAAIYVYNEGREDYVEVFGQLTKRDGSFLVSRVAEPDFDYSSLVGETVIAGRQGGVPAMTLEYVLKSKGLNNGQNVTLNFGIQFNMMAGAFIGGESGDYVALFEPTASDVVKEGKGYIVASIGADSGEVPYTAFMAKKSYIEKNERKLEKFLKAVYKAMQYIKNADEDTVTGLLVPHFPSTGEESIKASLQSYKAIDAWMSDPIMTAESFIRLQDIMESAGVLDTRAPYNKVVNNKIAEKVVENN